MDGIRAIGGLSPRQPDAEHPGPIALRVMLGAHLRQLREGRRISRQRAADAIRGSQSKISRLELGRTGYKMRDVGDLLTLYGVTDDSDREGLLTLAREASQPVWWGAYGEVIPAWFEQYLSLERDAQIIRTYEPCFVPGLLQTEDYARAVIRNGHRDAPEAEVEQRVNLRLHRQQVLHRRQPGPLRLWAILDEATLRRPAGRPATMRAQIRHLIEMAELPHVRICLMPFSAGQRGAVGGAVTILRFPEGIIPDAVYLEHPATASYAEKPDEVTPYQILMNELATETMSPQSTVNILRRMLKAG